MRKLFIFRLLFLAIFYLSGSIICHSKQVLADSLLILARNTNVNDTLRVRAYLNLYKNLIKSDPKNAISYNQEAMKLAKKVKYDWGLARSYDYIGATFSMLGDYSKAFEYKFYSLKLFEKIGSKEYCARVNNNIGVIFFRQGDYKNALKFYTEALRIAREVNQPSLFPTYIINIGETYVKSGEYDTAIKYAQEALQLAQERKQTDDIAFAYGILGLANHYERKYPIAQEYLLKALYIFEQSGYKYETSEYYIYLAQTHIAIANYSEAKNCLLKSIDIAVAINAKEWQKNALLRLSDIYTAQNDFKKSIECLRRSDAIKDSIFNEKNAARIAQMQTIYETDKKNKEIELLNKENALKEQNLRNQYYVISAISMLLIVALSFIIFYITTNKKLKHSYLLLQQKNEEIETQQEEILMHTEELRTTNDQLEIEKTKSDTLLLNILPASIATELKKYGNVYPQNFEMVSILFADFVSFSKISEKLEASEIVKILNTYFIAFDEICEKHQLEKIKTIGDSFMAAGGIPVPNTTNTIDAVNAAIDILRFVNAQNTTDWQIRIGVHTGPVVAGIIGKHKFTYDIWGDTVNIASRMESSCEPGKINISGATYQYIKNHFETIYRGKIAAKSKGEIDMYFVVV